ncbi:hypothetical protein ILUMI_17600 [Ignelater luminosus]|uniref:Uncharacterized protein n=1 Tax=Ignelater luminosus TaxID=2038154 RepID=A0A8K0CLF3_IGNLU|nr:hypothetical protein ILUMI_17600 [Ignelater luminosus]
MISKLVATAGYNFFRKDRGAAFDNVDTIDFYNMLDQSALPPLINESTSISEQKISLLNLIITSNVEIIIECSIVYMPEIVDHELVQFTLKVSQPKINMSKSVGSILHFQTVNEIDILKIILIIKSKAVSADAACDLINKDLQSIHLKSKEQKSAAIVFGRTCDPGIVSNQIKIEFDGKTITVPSIVRNVSVLINTPFQFDYHKLESLEAASSSSKLIYQSRQVLACKTKVLLCDSLDLSKLNYGDVLYGPLLSKRNG